MMNDYNRYQWLFKEWIRQGRNQEAMTNYEPDATSTMLHILFMTFDVCIVIFKNVITIVMKCRMSGSFKL